MSRKSRIRKLSTLEKRVWDIHSIVYKIRHDVSRPDNPVLYDVLNSLLEEDFVDLLSIIRNAIEYEED